MIFGNERNPKNRVFALGILVFVLPVLLLSLKPFPLKMVGGKDLISETAIDERIDSIVNAMTLEEKIAMLCGNSIFSSQGIQRLGIPELHYTDGPFGIREEVGRNSFAALRLTTDSATFFPTGSALAATWNPALAALYGKGIGEEAKTRGKDILLGPAVNITRSPLNGRTFEYLSEDPLLNSRLAVEYIKAVQSCGVAACVKHFAANNQETNRGKVDVRMDERSLHEIYLPAFKAAVKEAGVKTLMSAYNKLQGAYCAENDYLLNKILRDDWGFRGFVMSDWGGTHSTINSALNGLDVEMGSDKYFTKKLLEAVQNGQVPVSVIDAKVKRILSVILFVNNTKKSKEDSIISTPAHNKIAYEIASQAIILLKNTGGLLPLDLKRVKTIAVIGDNAIHKHAYGGFGAGVKARFEVTPLEGLKSKVGSKAEVKFAQGYTPKFLMNKERGWGRSPVNSPDSALIAEAVALAKKSDVTIIFVGTNHDVETEGRDRKELTLPFGQDALIKAVKDVTKNIIVVVVAGAPVDLTETDKNVSSIVWSCYNGSQGGTALADILVGSQNPSGKLPFSIPAKLEDSPAHALNAFPGDSSVSYKEGILVGYRWYETKKIKPLFCFGYGLSYTTFQYAYFSSDKSDYSISDTIKLVFKLRNTGKQAGMETVQLYSGKPESKISRPVRELRAFKKVPVEPRKSATFNVSLAVRDLAYFDEGSMKWIVEPGTYKLMLASSSCDVKASIDVRIK
jgi:beta-glucosidase